MSIVGTRPPLISETNLYEPRHKVRLAIKPGITGMWQVSGRSDITDFEEVVRLDDTHNQEPLFYEKYPGSLNDISQLQFMLDKAFGYGYKKIGFILDRGYFSSENIQYMDKCGYSFVIMVKGMASLVNELVLEHKHCSVK